MESCISEASPFRSLDASILNEANYVMREIRERICGNHSEEQSIIAKIVWQGYHWPTMDHDMKEVAKKIDRCQRFVNALHQPLELFTPI